LGRRIDAARRLGNCRQSPPSCIGFAPCSYFAGYIGEHIEQYENGRQTMATGRSMALERLARLKDERNAIHETRPPAAIAAALNAARRSERPSLREALALAKRRDALDIALAAFERELSAVPQVATADASAAVLSDISGTTVSEHELRRLRLALLLGLPLCGGLVLSLAFAFTACQPYAPPTLSALRPASVMAMRAMLIGSPSNSTVSRHILMSPALMRLLNASSSNHMNGSLSALY
jgi:hypothetical protein